MPRTVDQLLQLFSYSELQDKISRLCELCHMKYAGEADDLMPQTVSYLLMKCLADNAKAGGTFIMCTIQRQISSACLPYVRR
jgi:hypothetical protein